MPPSRTEPRPERAARIAEEQIKLRVKRAVTQIKAGGGVGFQAKTTPQEKLDYYKSKLFPNGHLNQQAALELAARTGVKGLNEVIGAMEQDFFEGPAEEEANASRP